MQVTSFKLHDASVSHAGTCPSFGHKLDTQRPYVHLQAWKCCIIDPLQPHRTELSRLPYNYKSDIAGQTCHNKSTLTMPYASICKYSFCNFRLPRDETLVASHLWLARQIILATSLAEISSKCKCGTSAHASTFALVCRYSVRMRACSCQELDDSCQISIAG